MSAGESWRGVYFHPVFGYLHLVEQNGMVEGRWQRADQSAWGQLRGRVDGNTLRFQWHEHKVGLVGPSAEARGQGEFQYAIGGSGVVELNGVYGLNDDVVGGDWNCVKQQRMNPDVKSIKGEGGLAGRWE